MCDIFSSRAGGISAQRWAIFCMWGGGGGEAMGEVERCPRERPGPGPEAAQMASVPMGEEVAKPRPVDARGLKRRPERRR